MYVNIYYGRSLRTLLTFLMGSMSFKPTTEVFSSIFQQCVKAKSISEGRKIHAQLIKSGINPDTYLQNNILNLYAKCGFIQEANQVFDKMSDKSLVSYNSMIAAFARHGMGNSAVNLLNSMNTDGFMKPNYLTFVGVLGADLKMEQAIGIHGYLMKLGLAWDAIVGNNLIDLYVGLGDLFRALSVFEDIPQKDLISWNSIIVRCVQGGFYEKALEMYSNMQMEGMLADGFTLNSIIRACAGLVMPKQGTCFHARSIKSGYEADVYVINALIDFYGNCDSIKDATRVFDYASIKNIVTWNSVICVCRQNGHEEKGVRLFREMKKSGVSGDSFTFSCLLKISSDLGDILLGKWIHAHVVHSGYEHDVVVESGLIDMYAKCGCLEDAQIVFNAMYDRDVVSWTAMVGAYVQHCYHEDALKCFVEMVESDTRPDSFAYTGVFQACTRLLAIAQGCQVHALVVKAGLDFKEDVGCAIVDMYSKWGKIEEARIMFDCMPEQNEVAWTAIISGYAQNGHGELSLRLYHDMLLAGRMPDEFTFGSVLEASACLTASESGKQIHVHALKYGVYGDVYVSTALVDMYAKCGSLDDAFKLFDRMVEKTVVSWNSIIVACAQHGLGKHAIRLFEQMQKEHVKPDYVTFIGVLASCSHSGLLNESYKYFHSMSKEHGVVPGMEHYACMVDVIGRAGHLKEAERFIHELPVKPDARVWKTLLGACRIHKNMELGMFAASKVLDEHPEDHATFVLLSNIYAQSGKADEVVQLTTQ